VPYSLWIVIPVYLLAAPAAAVGVYLLIDRSHTVSRETDEEEGPRGAGALAPVQDWRRGMPLTTRTVTGLCLVLVAYHGVAYVSPESWFGLKVPLERAWMLGLGVAIALVGSRISDRLESGGEGRGGG
jgi:hypothetical protein